jgi:hypothetical protein
VARVLLAIVLLLAASVATSLAQSDLEALMARVLAQRDSNWKKLQQYVLNERESLQVTGPGSLPIYGFRREYLWYPSTTLGTSPSTAGAGFVRSPLIVDGVEVSEAERRRAEARWIEREKWRSLHRGDEPLEPGFVSAAYFLNFQFEPGRYALVGRDTFQGREVLRIEYYPSQMFKEGRTRPNRRIRERDDQADEKMNKTSLVTLWVAPEVQQIVRYEFENIDMDFLPAQPVVRLEGAIARMEMGQPFPDVWLPKTLEIGFEMTLAAGSVTGRYSAEYYDYRLAEVTSRIR